jgi:type I restriction enzyme S subunit
MSEPFASGTRWVELRLSDLAWNVRDRVVPREHPDLPYIGMDSIEPHTMKLLGTVPSSTMKSAAVHFKPGDVLYGRLRPYLNKVITADFEGLASAEFIPLTTASGVLPRLIQYRLNSADFVSYASHLDGGDRPRVDYEQIGAFVLQIPPVAEQHRIVEAIERHFTRLDDAVATLERVRRNFRRYRASVINAAIQGRLVRTEAELARGEGRDYEPAGVLLERILAERRRRWQETGGRGKYQGPVGPDTTDLSELPEGWCWATVGQVAPLQAGYAFPSSGFRVVGIRLLKGNNVRDGWIATAEIDHWPEAETANFQHYRLSEGNVVLAMDRPVYSSGTKATKVALLDASWDGSLLLQRVGCFRHATSIDSRYLYLFVSGNAFRDHILGGQKGSQDGKDLPHVSAGTVDSCPFPLPPQAEQRRIVEAIESRLSVLADVNQATENDLARCRRLRQSILKWAFEGKLADQDPTDEPASVLLARIKAERKATGAMKKTGRTNKGMTA